MKYVFMIIACFFMSCSDEKCEKIINDCDTVNEETDEINDVDSYEDPVFVNDIVVSFSGPVNSQDALDNRAETWGKGVFTLYLNGDQSLYKNKLTAGIMSLESEPDKEYLYFSAMDDEIYTGDIFGRKDINYSYGKVSILMDKDRIEDLDNIEKSDYNEVVYSVWVVKYQFYMKDVENYLSRYCYIAVYDNSENPQFDAFETPQKIVSTDDEISISSRMTLAIEVEKIKKILTENGETLTDFEVFEGQLCNFAKNDVAISAEEYFSEMEAMSGAQ